MPDIFLEAPVYIRPGYSAAKKNRLNGGFDVR